MKFDWFNKIIPRLLAPAASIIIASGWQWYHFPRHPRVRFIIVWLAVWLAIWLVWFIAKKVYRYLVIRFGRHAYWSNEFFNFLNEFFFIASLFFLIFFSRSEIISLLWFGAVLGLLFWRLDYYLGQHPATQNWRVVARSQFVLSVFIFITSAVFQYFAYKYYILDSNVKFFNIVLFRSFALTMFWLGGFALASFLYLRLKNRWRHLFWIFWLTAFVLALLVSFANASIIYNSGLYLSPVMLEHAEGGGFFIFWKSAVVSAALFLATGVAFVLIFKKFLASHRLTGARYWYFFDAAIIGLAVLSFFAVASLRNTPEAAIIKSFYSYFKGAEKNVELSPVVREKLKRFGLNYNADNFYINQKEKIYQSDKKLLPDKLLAEPPNIIIVFLESFSSRLTEVYNPRLAGLTPGLKAMAEDSSTTIFHHVYNPSTPTVTGLMAELCSFLPPTGHNEIEMEKHLQNLHLFCLPEALNEAGWRDNFYMTAVDKDYANKDTILASMGVKEFWGTDELAKKISGEPLAWGYSDHQMFPVFFDELSKRAQPFLMMLSTVDTHPPFDLVKDEIKYEAGKNRLLNTIYTTDNAFKKFWEQFKASEFANNTIVVAIADHAVFPAAYTKDYFPAETGKMNFYDELAFMMYVPGNILPKDVDTYASAMDFAPTILQLLGLNGPNTFEGHSIFDDRDQYPDLLGMHEFGLWINEDVSGTRRMSYSLPADLNCDAENISADPATPLTLCEYFNYFQWKRQMFEEGRLWYLKK
ncbi:MAG: sulfatase-like hydrolase/transferase [Patescibacteria group bacterium]|nr:sulfatase-like hydrolase/transferase [Patescibacteria group bacterium]